MLTLASAARLLAAATDTTGLATLARAAGFDGEPAPLDAASRASLGLPASIRSAVVLSGRGTLRALCIEAAPDALTRDAVAALSVRLQRRSPFALWLLFATERRGDRVALAASTLEPRARATLLRVVRSRVVDSDAEAVRALAATAGSVDLLVHARWCEILGREALTHRFFRTLERAVGQLVGSLPSNVPPDDARTLAVLTSTRLLFLAFLEAKGWLDGDHGFLRRRWDQCTAGRGGFHRHVLSPLCFGTLNTPPARRAAVARAFGRIPFLNGGLFTRSALEREHAGAHFSDAALGAVVGDLLGRWRFTVREQTASQAEAAVDPEMLGRAFESLMASRERQASGTFYTPRALVQRVFDAALDASCASAGVAAPLAALRAGQSPSRDERAALFAHLSSITVLDPACGSGAFLVHALHELVALRARCGDALDRGALHRDILARQLFGVDREPTAVWLCELRLWLAVVVETDVTDAARVPPLPNLDAQIRIGDALAGDAFAATPVRSRSVALGGLRVRYARATGIRKRTLARMLARAERDEAVAVLDHRIASVAAARRDLLAALRGRDLFGGRIAAGAPARERLQTLRREARELRAQRGRIARGGAVRFDFAAQFADVGAGGGFHLVVGNPPWVRLHRIPATERASLRARFAVYREAGWPDGCLAAGAASGFAAQVDLAALFVERALSLARPGGAISLLVPAKLWRSLAGGGVRRLLLHDARLHELEDWSESRATFDAAVYPSLVVASREPALPARGIRVAEHHRDAVLRWESSARSLVFDASPGAPWLWLPRDPRDGFERVRRAGTPLGEDERLRPRLGVKCGCNDAFVVRRLATGEVRARDGRTAHVERALVRPLLRGDAVTAWRIGSGDDAIVVPHDRQMRPLDELPPLARRWLLPWRSRLVARSDARGRAPWWSLFRVDAAHNDVARVVWADLARSPRAAVLPVGDPLVPLNSCYVVRAPSHQHACALAAWLNSPLAAAWLAALAEPARGGYRRLLGWTVALLPVPRLWDTRLDRLASLGARGIAGQPPAAADLLDATLDALGVAHHQVEPLLTWGHR